MEIRDSIKKRLYNKKKTQLKPFIISLVSSLSMKKLQKVTGVEGIFVRTYFEESEKDKLFEKYKEFYNKNKDKFKN